MATHGVKILFYYVVDYPLRRRFGPTASMRTARNLKARVMELPHDGGRPCPLNEVTIIQEGHLTDVERAFPAIAAHMVKR